MATQWVILASVVTLALAVEPPEKAPLDVNCCDVDKVLPKIFEEEPTKCFDYVNGLHNEQDEAVIAKGTCSMLECILDANGLLSETKSVKEQEVKTLFMGKAQNDVKSIVEASLKECFEKYNNNSDRGKNNTCVSGAAELFGCFSKAVIVKCPKQFKRTDLPGCKGTDTTEKAAATKTAE